MQHALQKLQLLCCLVSQARIEGRHCQWPANRRHSSKALPRGLEEEGPFHVIAAFAVAAGRSWYPWNRVSQLP